MSTKRINCLKSVEEKVAFILENTNIRIIDKYLGKEADFGNHYFAFYFDDYFIYKAISGNDDLVRLRDLYQNESSTENYCLLNDECEKYGFSGADIMDVFVDAQEKTVDELINILYEFYEMVELNEEVTNG